MLRLLDSTVLIDYLRGRDAVSRVRAMRSTGEVPCTSAINVEEIVRGLRSAERRAAEELFAGLHVLPVGEPEAWLAGTWRRQFAARGVTLWQADCLVAATAHTAGAVLATGNPKDFPMEDLVVEHWPVGE
ncbi:MAG TPA: type II toxin-antitoxin system VapC family toxin [Cryptosporangiaceae bacterium]|nr:type II toxin-antitoxin system VapC family toxin [Cryptosporangiaceae bacterium]